MDHLPSSRGLSRRMVLGGAAGVAGLAALGPILRGRVAAFVPAGGPGRLAADQALAGWRGAQPDVTFTPVPVTSAFKMVADAAAVRADAAVSLLGHRHVALLAPALGARPLVALGAGADLHPSGERPSTVRWAELELAGALELATAWAARSLGPRAVLVGMGAEVATALPLAVHAGLAAGGGALVETLVASTPAELDALVARAALRRPDVLVALASGEAGARLLTAAAAAGLGGRVLGTGFLAEPSVLTAAGRAARGLLVATTWHEDDGAARAGWTHLGARAAVGAGAPAARVMAVDGARLLPRTTLTAQPTLAAWSRTSPGLRAGALAPFTGC